MRRAAVSSPTMAFPRQSEIEIPLLRALADSGGSAKPRDVYPKVAVSFPDSDRD